MLTDLTQADFQFYKSYFDKMRSCHDKEFMEEINPDLIRAFYRGRKIKDARFARVGYGMDDDEHLLMLSILFAGANTILPNLYYRDPRPLVTAIRSTEGPVSQDQSAALMAALLKLYMKQNNAKSENQDAVLNAYFFGLGWKKLGYTFESEPMQEEMSQEPETLNESQGFSFKKLLGMEGQEKPTPLQFKERMDFVDKSGLFNSSESPLNIFLDHKADLRNGKVRAHRVTRSLYELMNFGAYDQEILEDIYKKFKHTRGSRLDTRDIDLSVNEEHIVQRNGIWVLTWVDEFDKPIQYERSTWQGKGFQFVPLSFTNEPGVRYPISHMKIAVQVQDRIDKMASLFYQTVSRSRNMLFINQNRLQKGSVDAIIANKVQGIVLTNEDLTPGTFAHAQSPPVSNDLPSLIALCQQNLIQVMGSDEQTVTGRSKNKNLGQDEIAHAGTQVRESGMQDRVKDFMIEQFEKEAQLLKEYSDSELQLEITGEDYVDPIMAEKMEKQNVSFMSLENPIAAKRYIENVDFSLDMNVEEAVKPDREKIMNDIERVIAFTSNPLVETAINNDGYAVATGALAIEWMSNVESLGNSKKYLKKINSMQLAAIQARKVLMQGMGQGQGQPPNQKQTKDGSAGKPDPRPSPKEALV